MFGQGDLCLQHRRLRIETLRAPGWLPALRARCIIHAVQPGPSRPLPQNQQEIGAALFTCTQVMAASSAVLSPSGQSQEVRQLSKPGRCTRHLYWVFEALKPAKHQAVHRLSPILCEAHPIIAILAGLNPFSDPTEARKRPLPPGTGSIGTTHCETANPHTMLVNKEYQTSTSGLEGCYGRQLLYCALDKSPETNNMWIVRSTCLNHYLAIYPRQISERLRGLRYPVQD